MSNSSIAGSDQSAAAEKRKRKIFAAAEGYLYLAPTLIVLTIFVFIPIITSFQISLTRVAPFGGRSINVGFENYTRLFTSPEYRDTVRITLLFALYTVPTGIFFSVALAILLSYPLKRLSWLHRLLIFMPIVISTAVTGVLFRWIYHPVVGYLNYILEFLPFIESGPNWLNDADVALISVSMAVVWRQLGFNTIIALAGIQNIDEVYYEAAKVDGASTYHRIRHIMLPLLTPTLFFLLIINVINSLQVFGEINILTSGSQATRTMLYSIYNRAFIGTPQVGQASAEAYLLFLLILVLSVVQFRFLGNKVNY
ncbi:MAG: sugar ABC transporter permease [Chloroflexota bacterium]